MSANGDTICHYYNISVFNFQVFHSVKEFLGNGRFEKFPRALLQRCSPELQPFSRELLLHKAGQTTCFYHISK